MKVAIVHYWLVGMRGGEAVLEVLCEMFPQAVIYTHVYNPEKISETIKKHEIKTSFINSLPMSISQYQKYLPLMPGALAELDLTEFDLVISSESGPAKGVVTNPNATHLCYVHSPMRYIWDQYHVYKKQTSWLAKLYLRLFVGKLRAWDTMSANSVDIFIANSNYVSNRIKKYYRRESVVINPPVDVNTFSPLIESRVEEYYLWVGELVSYKRPDIVIEAFNQNKKRLLVVGDGSCRSELQKKANDNIKFVGRISTREVKKHLSKCKALVFPGVEDFGIVPVEVLASGRPVIAYGEGGVLDSVQNGVNGILYHDNTSRGLSDAIELFEQSAVSGKKPIRIAETVQKFNKARFMRELLDVLSKDKQKIVREAAYFDEPDLEYELLSRKQSGHNLHSYPVMRKLQ